MTALWLVAAALLAATPAEATLAEAQAAFDQAQPLKAAGRFADAAPHVERALELAASVLDPADETLASVHLELANLYLYDARYDRAEPHYVAALRIGC